MKLTIKSAVHCIIIYKLCATHSLYLKCMYKYMKGWFLFVGFSLLLGELVVKHFPANHWLQPKGQDSVS